MMLHAKKYLNRPVFHGVIKKNNTGTVFFETRCILLWPFNRPLLRHCKRLSKQAYRSAANWLFVRIFWTSVRCRPTSNCRCCLLMSNSSRDARHFAVTDQPRWSCRRQHRLARPRTALPARTLGNVKVQQLSFFTQTSDMSVTTNCTTPENVVISLFINYSSKLLWALPAQLTTSRDARIVDPQLV